MTFWLDAQFLPQFAPWLSETFGVEVYSLRFLGLRDATDMEIFQKAKLAKVIITSKDQDFIDLIQRLGSPPKLIWVTLGNVTNANLRRHFQVTFNKVIKLLETSDIVELSAAHYA